MNSIVHDILMRSIKMIDISLLGIYYLIGGILLSNLINRIMPDYNKEEYDSKSKIQIILELFANTILIMISAYILRNIVALVPFPLDGVYGYNHSIVKEVSGGVIISFAVIVLQSSFKRKLEHVVEQPTVFDA
jgi:hypothetical protein